MKIGLSVFGGIEIEPQVCKKMTLDSFNVGMILLVTAIREHGSSRVVKLCLSSPTIVSFITASVIFVRGFISFLIDD